MKKLSWGKQLRAVGMMLAFMPLAYAGTHAAGFPEAEACSGGAPQAGTAPPGARLHRAAGGPSMELATDGFFLIDTFFSDPDIAISGTTVAVTTADGANVPGSLKVYAGGSKYLGWEASVPIPVGTQLKIELTPSPALGFSLPDMSDATIVGEPTSLSAASLTFGAWYEFHHGLGAPVTCTAAGAPVSNCGPPPTLTVYEQEEKVPAVDLTWAGQPEIKGFVLWEGSVEVAPEQMPISQISTGAVMAQADQPKGLGRLGFPAGATEHCATLSVRDLRSGQVVTAKTCGDVQGGNAISDYADVKFCSAPPNSPTLAAQWCAGHPEFNRPPCVPQGFEHPADPDPTPTPIDPSNDPLGDDMTPASGARTSSACQMSPGPARGAGLGFVFAALALVGVVRRQRSRKAAAQA